jgi:hypothetical protein
MAEVFGVTCTVNPVGAAADSGDGPNPVTYINLTDTAGSFNGFWFFAADAAKREILATALAAVSSHMLVNATIITPNANNDPYTPCLRLYIIASG